ncbi:LAMI_0H16930g1_1 [Lachancea mirantina]|uniref:LAMI_0H16930g1_1 n=1 Tax=Lachancea mirantina TaxID=1230905 RepID=A0A1G4KJ79_9SACH|nr:LAMI_0H16930g1_1 [Lachancea mirantina]
MASTEDQWFNPSDMLNLGSSDRNSPAFDQFEGTQKTEFNSASSIANDNVFNSFLTTNYQDVDEFLTQELKDLDIPMMPERPASIDGDVNYDAVWDQGFESVATPRKSHKRGPSGTAIFGFTSHNRELSITKTAYPEENGILLEKYARDDALETAAEHGGCPPKLPDNSTRNFNTAILKQQEELRVALEKQQEMNKKLEERLRQSQFHQQQLQLALQEQKIASHQYPSAPSSQVRGNDPSLQRPASKDDPLIVTNNANGAYKFPPPPNTIKFGNGTMSPMSRTSINGSPVRRNDRAKRHGVSPDLKVPQLNLSSHVPSPDSSIRGSSNGENRISFATIQKMSKYFESLNNEHQQAHGSASEETSRVENAPITPQNRVQGFYSSRSPSPRGVKHMTKDSISSSASTIPQLHDDEEHDHEPNCLPRSTTGLGIRYKDGKTGEKFSIHNAPYLADLPTIPGSTDNTPHGQRIMIEGASGGLPQKHMFQHTPIKKNNINHYALSACASQHTDILDSLKEDLRPPGSVNPSQDFEPESEFVQAQTPSPILKSQCVFEGETPVLEPTYLSPMKITRKPTTLPPGEIDRYVKELPDRTFACLYPHCGKHFRRRYNIRSHIQTHLEDRPYMCDFEGCNKAFVRNHDLIRHKKTHAEKCFVCPCGKKFVREDALLVHRSRMICVGGKRFENVVIKKSPRKRGRPRKDGLISVNSSPVKETVERDNTGMVALRMEEQLRRELMDHGLLDLSHSSDAESMTPA